MSLQESFDKAVEDVKNLKTTPADKELLKIYALYKQATVGNCNTEKPSFLDLKGKSKWSAWVELKDTMTQDEAKKAYVEKVNELIEIHELKC